MQHTKFDTLRLSIICMDSAANRCPYLHLSTAQPAGRVSHEVGRRYTFVSQHNNVAMQRIDKNSMADVRYSQQSGRKGVVKRYFNESNYDHMMPP